MNTFFALMAEYGTAHIPVENCASLFGMSPRKACDLAGRQAASSCTGFSDWVSKNPLVSRRSKISRIFRQCED